MDVTKKQKMGNPNTIRLQNCGIWVSLCNDHVRILKIENQFKIDPYDEFDDWLLMPCHLSSD